MPKQPNHGKACRIDLDDAVYIFQQFKKNPSLKFGKFTAKHQEWIDPNKMYAKETLQHRFNVWRKQYKDFLKGIGE